MKVHQNTLKLYMKRHNVEHQYSALSNANLDILTKRWQEERPESGIRYLVGFLHRHRLQIQMWRVDNVGQALQQRQLIFCHKYTVKQPDALWHVDGHHKLIHWGVVIHGMVDGYSQMVCGSRYRVGL